MVRAGYAVRFVEQTAVSAAVPTTAAAESTQRARWEGGRLRMLRELAPSLAADVLRGRGRSVEPLGELLLLPLASHVGALLVVLVLPFPPTQLYAAGALLGGRARAQQPHDQRRHARRLGGPRHRPPVRGAQARAAARHPAGLEDGPRVVRTARPS
ncbi:MAG: hypothetical protein IPH72_19095 [Sandaracinaceae bacterium]|nr:hypothetical protein [Sandaracinaceae bacterium]